MGPIPPNVQPETSPPNAPATNGHIAFATALAISSQSISSFMSFPFLVVCCYSIALFCAALCVLANLRKMPGGF